MLVENKRLVLWLAGVFGALTVLIGGVILSPIVLDVLAPSPEQFMELPVRLASNPNDVRRWDFTSPHPQLHVGDSLVGFFHVCYSDIFGGASVLIVGTRVLVSIDNRTRATLNSTSIPFPVGCHDTPSVIDQIPALPTGTYYVDGQTTAIAAHYRRALTWTSVPFDIVPW
jgi:hypothetical protein